MISSMAVRAPGRVLAAALTAVLVLTGVVMSASAARAADPDRVGGENRFDTAKLIADGTFDASVTDVVLATGYNYPDALASAGLAGTLGAPVLLTRVDSLPPETVAALQALSPDTVHIAGGTDAVSKDVADVLSEDYAVERYPGLNRYETAALIAEAVAADANTAIVATGQNFPDAVAGGPLAYAGPHPVLLVTRDAVPQVTEDALNDLEIDNVIILGESDAVSADVEADLEEIVGSEAVRLGGEHRADTAAEIAQYAVDNAGFDLDEVLIANGWQNLGVDALAGGPHGGVLTAPILLVEKDDLPPATEQFLNDNAAFIDTVRALGGPAVIDQTTLEEAAAAATADFEGVTLSWENEYREATGTFRNGEPGATGTASVALDADNDTVDFAVDYSEVTGPFSGAPGFHIHVGGIADEGPVVIPLTDGATLDADADKIVTGTLTTAEMGDLGTLIDSVLANPEGHYLNLHSEAYPAGAIRGQLPDGGQNEIPAADGGVVTAADVATNTYSFQVDGAAEARTVSYSDADSFIVDGDDTATVVEFEAAINAGDAVEFTAGAADAQVHALTDNPGPAVAGSTEVAIGASTWEITFSEAPDPATLDCMDIAVVGGSQACTGVSFNEDGTVATVTFDAAFVGGESLTLAADSVTDFFANPGPAEVFVATAVDLTGPTVVSSTDPQIGDTTWDITFDEAIDPESLTCDDISVSEGETEVCAATNVVDAVATVTFANDFGGDEVITLAAESVTDILGNAGPTEEHSKTVVDATAPTVVSTGEVAIGASTWEITFSEALAPDSLVCADITVTGGVPACAEVALDTAGTVATITFDSAFAGGETITLASGSVTDLAGNAGPASDATATVPVQ